MTNKRVMLTAALATAVNGLAMAGRAEEMPLPRPVAQEAAGGGNMPTMPAGVLQVSGSTNSFVISAQRADVLSLLKLVFNQAHRQFVPDASVTGDVTFALSGQKLETVLDAVCRQAFLRYDIDRNNIYQFRRDEQALRNFILKTQIINTALQEQVRRMGYTVPQNLAAGASGLALGGGSGGSSAGSFGRENAQNQIIRRSASQGPAGQAGPLGVQNTNAPGEISRVRSDNSQDAAPVRAENGSVIGAVSEQNTGLSNSQTASQTTPNLSVSKGQNGRAGQGPLANANAPRPVVTQERAKNAQQFGERTVMPNLEDSAQYQLFLKQNNFVMFNTQERDTPVRDVLLDLSRQSGVPIYIDPAVPGGDAFVVNGYVTPRPLVEVLNYLAYKARLEWRWINNRVYVTTTPQLNLFLRGALLPPPQAGLGVSPPPQNARSPQNSRSARPPMPQAQSKPDTADKVKTKNE